MSLSARARSPRALASAVAVALAAWSGGASAAGLGRLTVQSSLGQPLRAEVEITSVAGDEAATLAARLASAEAFRQAGMDFGATQQNLRFGVERRGEGRYVVRITSAQAINEPFVDLLVELNSSAGRFVREYTFLLDPPELRSVQQAAAASRQDAVVAPQVAGGTRVESARAPRAARAPSQPDAAPQAFVARDATGEAITVQRGDTLAAIARRVRPADASVEQTAAALYRANPGAFGGSPDLLRAGSTLNVPEAASIAAVDAAEARRELRMRAQDFQSYRDRLAAAPRQTEPARAGQSATGRIGASVEDRAAPAENADQLRLSRAAGGAATAGAAGSQASRAAATEQRYARDAALAEVDARMRQLERNLSDLQRLVELKDQSLATMQRQLEEARSSSSRAAAATARAGGDAATVPAPAASPAASSAAPAPDSPNGPATQPPTASAPAGDAVAATIAGPVGDGARGKAADVPSTSAAAPAQPQVAAPASAAPPASEGLLDNEYLLPGLGGLALLGAGYAWLAVRRRRQADRQDEGAIAGDAFASGTAFATVDDAHEAVDDAAAGQATQSAAETQSTEVDPIAEAEVYIAYGREQQAEEILREALRQQPDRQPVRAKLLEIHAGRHDAIGFGELAGEMYVATQGLNPEWPQVASLGRSIDPDNPLYASGEEAVAQDDVLAGDAESAAPAAPLVDEADRAAVPVSAGSLGAPQPDEEIAALDFELDLDTTIGRAGDRLAADAQPIEAIVPAARQTSDLAHAVGGDFELPSLELDDVDVQTERPAAAARFSAEPAPEIDLSGISLDLEPVATSGQDADSARWQEMSTKLDLAAAYDEIGDREGARELLDEVMRDGDAQQQQRARSMLASFA